jgi:hypothetical protein
MSPNIIKVVKSTRIMWASYIARMGGFGNVSKILFGEPEEKRQLERPSRR